MLKRILSGLGLVAALATSASATNWMKIHQNGGGPTTSYDVFTGELSSTGQFGTYGSSFNIWCIDQKNDVSNNDNYQVNLTNLGGSDFTKTRQTSATNYIKAARIVEYMHNVGATGTQTNDFQYAIWHEMHGKANDCDSWNHTTGVFQSSPALVGCSTGGVDAVVNTYSSTSINLSEWRIITNVGAAGNDWTAGVDRYQEFLAKCLPTGSPVGGYSTAGSVIIPPFGPPTTPLRVACGTLDIPNDFTTTPEPATMSLLALGLAGMAGASVRRRKK